ncbi:hypothetical protein GGX14DRAFT_601694 [Mycena pura]|uniref:Uncharacterized protein n=1 Tax=Mycena pura TaxID=153505 RepID=A0AAD6VLT3_9AGAR|nr:hypothetical protein GGX14DRAFT_601694 [Mycena pura]
MSSALAFGLAISDRHWFADVAATAARPAGDVAHTVLSGWLIQASPVAAATALVPTAAAPPPAGARWPIGLSVAPDEPDVVLAPTGQRALLTDNSWVDWRLLQRNNAVPMTTASVLWCSSLRCTHSNGHVCCSVRTLLRDAQCMVQVCHTADYVLRPLQGVWRGVYAHIGIPQPSMRAVCVGRAVGTGLAAAARVEMDGQQRPSATQLAPNRCPGHRRRQAGELCVPAQARTQMCTR